MARINLISWREQRRTQEKKLTALLLLGSILSAIILVCFMRFYILKLVHNQIVRNQFLNTEMFALDKQIKEIKNLDAEKQLFLSKIVVLQRLQMMRVSIAYLFTELINLISGEVSLDKMEGKNAVISLEGHAKTESDVYALMQGMKLNQRIHQLTLTEIKLKQEEPMGYGFKLKFVLRHVAQ